MKGVREPAPRAVARSVIERDRARVRVANVAGKIGTGVRAVADAEKGKPSTGIAVYAAMLWALDLLDPLSDIAAPERDAVGQTLALSRGRERARPSAELNNDF